ncbi:MAG: 3-phenylpropionate/cinnamic acid dioxygenase small subunit [Acidimicrobiales bacterium]|jgi:3-phenylpropionate/cinnamic acid dioxygenase small subunit
MPYTTEQLSDRQDIVDLLTSYCRAIDDNRPADVAAMFIETCVLDYGGDYNNLEGRRLAHKFFAGGTDRLYKRSAHHLSNIEVAFTGPDSADTISYVNAWHEFNQDQFEQETPNAWIYGRYIDNVVREADGWRIAKRTFRAMGDEAWASPMTYIDRN